MAFDPNGVYPYISYSETANRPVSGKSDRATKKKILSCIFSKNSFWKKEELQPNL